MTEIQEAMDTAMMQSAYYYVSGELGAFNDTWAENSFINFVDRYVQAKRCIVPLPAESLGVRNSLIDLWCEDAEFEKELGPPVQDKQLQLALWDKIVWVAENLPTQTASWIAMQWTPQVVKEYLSRGTMEHIDAVIEQHGTELSRKEFTGIKKSLEQLLHHSDFRMDSRYLSRAASAHVDIVTYALAYGISCQFRGRQYADGLAEKRPGIRYTYHWVRDLMVGLEGIDTQVGQLEEIENISWGNVLFKQIKAGNLRRDVSLILDKLRKLRNIVQGKQYQGDLNALRVGGSIYRPEMKKDLEALELKVLGHLRLPPIYRETTLAGALSKGAQAISEASGSAFGKAAFQLIDLLSTSKVMRAIDARVVRTISMNWFWRNFWVPGVRR